MWLSHFEFLVLEGAPAGLSWSTVLRKREAYRHATWSTAFDIEKSGGRAIELIAPEEHCP